MKYYKPHSLSEYSIEIDIKNINPGTYLTSKQFFTSNFQ